MIIHNTYTYSCDEQFVSCIEQLLAQRHLSQHPFYKTWNEGGLSLHALQEYARQYYAFVAAFPTYVSRVHSNTPYTNVRLQILHNLIEEEHPELLHEELWIQFAEGTGVARESLGIAEQLFPETTEALRVFQDITSRDFIEGAAALLAYESQISDIADLKMIGLQKYYGITDKRSLHFFEEHKIADIEHQKVWKWIIGTYANTQTKKENVVVALHDALGAMWSLLDGTHRVHCS